MSQQLIHTTPDAYTIKKDVSQPIEAIGRFGLRLKTPVTMQKYHWHGHIELNWLLNGRLVYLFDGTEVEIPKNQLILFNASIPHRSKFVAGEGDNPPLVYNLYFPFDQFLQWPNIKNLQQNILEGAMMVAKNTHELDEALIKCWYKDSQSHDIQKQKLIFNELKNRVRRMEVEGWDYLISPQRHKGERVDVSSKDVQHVVQIMQYITANFHRPIDNKTIAKEVGLHPNYAMNLFSKVMNVPLKQYLRRMRLFRAHALMVDTDLPASTIAYDAGFGSVSRFYEVFKAQYQMAPNEYRKKIKSQNLRGEENTYVK